uniref:Uncharacterized protein LOC110200720 isoform X1 n=1 Tax=Phascolarctos cinereus TaxID=38626 RepID=A0A6P5JL34_PHACI|nr:uncharacterized protein LOC110200720 isoform X1 [Phascolarctos cinereus]
MDNGVEAQANNWIIEVFSGLAWRTHQARDEHASLSHRKPFSLGQPGVRGTVAIITEKKRRRSLAKITVGLNIIGIIYAIYGLITLVIEFLSYDSMSMQQSWPERSGKLLSDYLFIYTTLYVFISWIILRWNHKAIFYSPN